MARPAGELSVLQWKRFGNSLLFLRARLDVHRVDVNSGSIGVAAAKLLVISAELEMRVLAGTTRYRRMTFIAVLAGVMNRGLGSQARVHKMQRPCNGLSCQGTRFRSGCDWLGTPPGSDGSNLA